MNLLKKIGIIFLALVLFVIIFKIINVVILIIGALIFGDGSATTMNDLGAILGFIFGAVLAQKMYRHFFPLTKKEKSFKLTK